MIAVVIWVKWLHALTMGMPRGIQLYAALVAMKITFVHCTLCVYTVRDA